MVSLRRRQPGVRPEAEPFRHADVVVHGAGMCSSAGGTPVYHRLVMSRGVCVCGLARFPDERADPYQHLHRRRDIQCRPCLRRLVQRDRLRHQHSTSDQRTLRVPCYGEPMHLHAQSVARTCRMCEVALQCEA